jgi:hypothetical protein
MNRISNVILSGFGVLALCTAATAQNRGRYPYDPPRGGYGYGDAYNRSGPDAYSRNQPSVVGRVMVDLDRAARSARLDDHELNHFREVSKNLREFEDRLARGKFDNGKLDKAIGNLSHLADSDRIRGRERDMLRRDLDDLRRFRATRGSYDQNRGYYPGYR